ncbi:MAG: PilW family protein [Rhodanobacteraceae bacterium]
MNRIHRHVAVQARRRMAGLSLIEMMIALVMALIVAAGIISVFESTSSSNKVQAQLATLQEEGRFAIHSLRNDLANANGGYCSNTGGNAQVTSSNLYLDALRSPTIYANAVATVNAVFADDTTALPGPNPDGPYALPAVIYMRGYECTATAPCKPSLTALAVPNGVPAMGTAVGDRVKGADVLTLRYLKPGSGWALVPSTSATGSYMETTGGTTTITLRPLTSAGEPPATTFTGSLAMLADCSNAQVFAVSNAGGVLTVTGANYAQPLDITEGAAPRVFDFDDDFQTVTYYLRVVCADGSSPCVHTTGELVRRFNGKDQPLVRGVERLDFEYGIVDANGNTEYLDAEKVSTGVDAGGNSIPCPPGISTNLQAGMPGNTPATGCLWRAVQTIQVHILMDGQTPLYTMTPAEMYYIYSPDGDTTPEKPSAHTIKPKTDQGFPQHLLRREFTTVVALRNFNP